MSFTIPKVHYVNLLEAASTRTPTPAEASTYPLARAYDRAKDYLFKFGSTSTTPKIETDQGSTHAQSYDRLIIPAGHNLLSGDVIAVYYDDNGGFSSPTQILNYTVLAADVGAQISQAFSSPSPGDSNDRYWRIAFTLGVSAVLELPELFITQDVILDDTGGKSLLAMPAVEGYISNLLITQTQAGHIRRLQLGEPKKYRNYEVAYLTLTDQTLLETFEAGIGYGRKAFYFTDHHGETFLAGFQQAFVFTVDKNPAYSKASNFIILEVL